MSGPVSGGVSGAHWHWQFADQAGQPYTAISSPVFMSRIDAETWLGEQWRTLAHAETAQLVYREQHVGPQIPLTSNLDNF